MINVTFKLTADDYVAAQWAHRASNTSRKWTFRILNGFFALLIVLSFVLLMLDASDTQWLWISGAYGALMLFLLNPVWLWRRYFRKAKNVHVETNAVVTEEGINFSNEYAEGV